MIKTKEAKISNRIRIVTFQINFLSFLHRPKKKQKTLGFGVHLSSVALRHFRSTLKSNACRGSLRASSVVHAFQRTSKTGPPQCRIDFLQKFLLSENNFRRKILFFNQLLNRIISGLCRIASRKNPLETLRTKTLFERNRIFVFK
jgi:hypothetical protein